MLDMEFCAEFQEPLGTLEVSRWEEAYRGFGPGLRGVAEEYILVCFGVDTEFLCVSFLKS